MKNTFLLVKIAFIADNPLIIGMVHSLYHFNLQGNTILFKSLNLIGSEKNVLKVINE